MPARKSTSPKPEKNKSLEQWIWDAACSIRGAKDAPKYKDFILPLIFTKRLCDAAKEWGHSCPQANGKKKNGNRSVATPLKLYDQDQWAWGAHLRRAQRARRVRQRRKLPNQYVADTWAMACMNMIIHDMEGTIEIGDTFKNPKFRDKRGKLRTFDRVVATAQRGSAVSIAKPHLRSSSKEDNPMWNQDWFTEADYDADEFDRFPAKAGFPGKSSADWGWTQHISASLKADGRAAVVWDTGAASRGSGNAGDNKEKAIHQWFVDRDLVESVPVRSPRREIQKILKSHYGTCEHKAKI